MRAAGSMVVALMLPLVALGANLSGTITGDVVLPAGQHRLVGGLTIAASGSLTLSAGASVRVMGNYAVSVYGTLRADGTDANPCSFFFTSSGKGKWQGVFVFTGGSLIASHTTFAGPSDAVTCNGGQLQLTDCTIKDCGRDGVVAYGTSVVTIARCSFSNISRRGLFLETTDVVGSVKSCDFSSVGEYPIMAKATLVEMLEGPFTFTSSGRPFIGVSCSADEDITDADRWRNLGYDYDLTAGSSDELLISPTGELTIEPGTRLRCGRIHIEGTLRALPGTARTVFYGPNGDDGGPGDWPGMEVAGGACQLNHCTVENAHTCITASGGHVTLTDCILRYAQFDGLWTTGATELDVAGCRFWDAGRSGMRITSARARGLVSDCSFARCGDWPIFLKAGAVGLLGDGLSFTDNARQAIGVDCIDTVDVTVSQTWRAQPVPYNLAADPAARLVAVARSARLTIDPGVWLYNGGLAASGTLEVLGTADDPVILASTGADACLGIVFRAGSTGTLRWVDVSGANTAVTVRDSSPRLDFVVAHACRFDGLVVTGSSARPVVSNCSFVNNGRYGVRIENYARPNLGDVGDSSATNDGMNQIFGNGGPYDLVNHSSKLIKAENNWWGTDSVAAIQARIWDRTEDASVGVVDIWPYLASRPNNAPELRWLGADPYAAAGVAPQLGGPATTFTWKVLYSDPDGDPARYVRVHILRNGAEIAGSPFDMATSDPSPHWKAGVVFEYSATLPSSRAYTYYFDAADQSLAAVGEPTAEHPGPLVTSRPRLSWVGTGGYAADGVNPNSGFDDTAFDFRVKYTDADGDPPTYVYLHVYLNGHPIAGSPFKMKRISGDPKSGAVYQKRLVLSEASQTGYKYKFTASDGLLPATGTPTQFHTGPSVRYRPHLTYVGTAGYERDGVDPQAAAVGTRFRFAVIYRHRGGREPAFVRVHVTLGGTEVAGSPWEMSPADTAPVTQGRQYATYVTLKAGRDYSHWFEASDGTLKAAGPATHPADGPLADRRPVLSFPSTGDTAGDGLSPDSGSTGSTQFVWEVLYRDGDGDFPRYVALRLYLDGKELPDSPFLMSPVPGGDVKTGKLYRLRKRLTRLGQWQYQFIASDGFVGAAGEPTHRRDGPAVRGGVELLFPETGPLAGWAHTPTVGSPEGTKFTFYVIYRHHSGKPPAWVRLKLRRHRSTSYVKTYYMAAVNRADVTAGRLYKRVLTLPDDHWTYWFEASDGTSVCRTDELAGPTFDRPPELSWVGKGAFTSAGVSPKSGDTASVFSFRVRYRDPDGDEPKTTRAVVFLADRPGRGFTVQLAPEVRHPDFAAGVVYSGTTAISIAGEYRYMFQFDDGLMSAVGEPTQPHDGPTVRDVASSALALTAAVSWAGPKLATVTCRATAAGCVFQGRVLNIAGRPVAALAVVEKSDRGAVLTWNYVNSNGSRVPPGTYLLVVEAVAPGGGRARAVVPLLVRAP